MNAPDLPDDDLLAGFEAGTLTPGQFGHRAHVRVGYLLVARLGPDHALAAMRAGLKRVGFVNITPRVEEAVRRSGVVEGLVLVNAMHITASVFINDDEPGLHQDYRKWLEELAPFDASPTTYAHNRTGEDNANAYLKRSVGAGGRDRRPARHASRGDRP